LTPTGIDLSSKATQRRLFEMGGVYITTKRVCVGDEAMFPNYFGRAA
jgi:hypothetical protein